MDDERLDIRLARETGLTRSRVERLIRQGRAKVDGQAVEKPGLKVEPQAQVTLDVPPPAAMEAEAEDLPLTVLYEDEDLAVIDKPCGMVVHPAAGNETGTLVNALLHHLSGLSGIGGTLRPGIVHRLDKDTSGLLLIAKNDETHLALSEALKERAVQKTYRAVAAGRLKAESGVIEASIARHPNDRKRMAVMPGGRYARTEYELIYTENGASLVNVRLITGRTHQIRVHFAHIGHPLVGDPIYGGKQRIKAPRLMLHALQIDFMHPRRGGPMHFEAPEPREFLETIQKLFPMYSQKDTACPPSDRANY